MKKITKNVIITIIVLFAVVLFATPKVNAAMTDENIQKILEIMPNEITLDIPEIEYGKARNMIENKVKDILKENNVEVSDADFYVSYYETYGGLEYFYKATISMQGTHNVQEKEIKIKYNNTDKHNASDEQKIKNIKLESPRYYEVELKSISFESYFELIANYYKKFINDNSIVIKANTGAGGSDGTLNLWTWGATNLGIFKNGMLYDIKEMCDECTVPVITVPSYLGENEIKNYIANKITSVYDKIKITNISKGAIISANSTVKPWSKEVQDGYTIIHTDKDGLGTTVESYVIVRKEQTQETPVVKNDKDTNIKLETTTKVLPSDVMLEVKPIEKSNIVVLEDMVNNFIAYDITLKSNGVEIQPNGKVNIKIPVPEGYDTSKLVVYRIDGTNKIKYDVTIETIDGVNYAVFETDHFSTYVLADLKEKSLDNNNEQIQETETENKKGDKDETPKTGTVDAIKYISIVTLMSAVGIVAIKRK